MTSLQRLFQPPPQDFPKETGTASYAPRYGLMFALVIVCLLPRIVMALSWDVLWGDTIVYLRACDALREGNFDRAFAGLGMNTYPALLLVFRELGLPVTTAAVWWSVLMSSLTALPLFGWARRQFDDRIAVLACLLYAMHPKLLGFSPLTIRDPTFWFLFALTLYLLWRATTEARWRWFLLAGVSLTLSCYTRTEGWVLLVPAVLWPAGRLLASPGKRLRLTGGTAVCLAAIPVMLVAVNLTLLRNHTRWELGNNYCITHALRLVGLESQPAKKTQQAAKEPSAKLVPQPAPAASEPAKRSPLVSPVRLIGKVLSRLVKALTYPYGILVLTGLICGSRVFIRREHQTIFLMNALLMIAIGMRQSLDGIDVRYYLPIVIVGMPFMAMGFLKIVQGATLLLAGGNAAALPSRQTAAAVGLGVVMCLIGTLYVMPIARPLMYEQGELGRWISDKYGPEKVVAGSRRRCELVKYYSDCHVLKLIGPREYSAESVLPHMETGAAELVLLWREGRYDTDWKPYDEKILSRLDELGYREIPNEELPVYCRNVRVLIRLDRPPKIASSEKASRH